ncbi:TPA: StbB family protein [Pseudomonas putida]
MGKYAVLNYTGSAGKTVIAAHLLQPRMPEATFYAVESINQSAKDLGVKDVIQLRGNNVGELLEKMVLDDDAIIDIGASNIEPFFEAASRFAGAIDDFDMFIVPVTPEQKAWQESLKTVEALAAVGVPAEKIILLPNRILKDPQEEIPAVYKYVKNTKKAQISTRAFIFESEVFQFLAHRKISFAELLNDDIDYRALARQEEDEEKAKEYARMYRWTKQAIPVNNNLADCFNVLSEYFVKA